MKGWGTWADPFIEVMLYFSQKAKKVEENIAEEQREGMKGFIPVAESRKKAKATDSGPGC